MKEWRKNYQKEPVFSLATINDDRLVTENGIFTQKDGKFYKQPSSDYFENKKIKEITKDEFQKEIDSFNKKRQEVEDAQNNCTYKNKPIAFAVK
jgi:uncharacterized lipoprotein YehR (DUF1307 family)